MDLAQGQGWYRRERDGNDLGGGVGDELRGSIGDELGGGDRDEHGDGGQRDFFVVVACLKAVLCMPSSSIVVAAPPSRLLRLRSGDRSRMIGYLFWVSLLEKGSDG
jgi:hypothetical protein